MISRQKGLSTPQTCIFCHASMHVCRFSFHLECPFLHLCHTSYPASLSHTENSFSIFSLNPSHTSFPSPQAEWLASSSLLPNTFFNIYIALIASLYNNSLLHRLYLPESQILNGWMNKGVWANFISLLWYKSSLKLNHWNVTDIFRNLWNIHKLLWFSPNKDQLKNGQQVSLLTFCD